MEVSEIVRATVHYTRPFASASQNVFHWQLADTASSDEDVVDEIVDWVTNDWGADWQAMAATQATLQEVDILIVNVAGEVLRDLGTETIAINGTRIFTVLAAATSAYLQGNTNIPQVRGAKYIPGASENELNNGAWTNEMLATMALLLIEWLTDINIPAAGILISGVLSSRESAFVPFNNTGGVEQSPAYQRRRKQNVGE